MLDGGAYSPERGNKVFVRSKLGMSMVVGFVQVTPPTRAAIIMVTGLWFIKKFAGTWIFEAINPMQTRARFRYSIQIQTPVLRQMIESLALACFQHHVRKCLIGLKKFYEKANNLH